MIEICEVIADINKIQEEHFVDFGIYDVNKPSARDFVNGFEKSILLDFNVEGPVLQTLAD